MDTIPDYIEINKALWNEKTKHHTTSAFYNMDNGGFIGGESSLKEIELALLGDIKGKTILHLQCHFGQDSLSLSRMGAHVTGVDFSDEAIRKARELNEQLGLDAQFICSDIYELPSVLNKQFDIVYTSYGTIGWLPDMQRWAKVVAGHLRPGGRFVFVEFHPVMWMFNNQFTEIQYAYFNKEAIVETLSGTYADRDADIQLQEIGWNHDLSEVMQSLIGSGLSITSFKEYDYSPYNCFANMVPVGEGRFHIQGLEGKLPMLYSLIAAKL
jgi:2-polyprenyl-3-methyl-5-hydroxy-6-metoxy-1,4-benzoquinol methylase